MKKLLAILLSAMLVFSMVACSNDTPSPQAPVETPTELDKINDKLDSASSAFESVEPEDDGQGNLVQTIKNIEMDGYTIKEGTKKVASDGTETTALTIEYEENGQKVQIQDTQSEKVTVANADVSLGEEEIKEVTTAALTTAKAIPASQFVRTGENEYTYTPASTMARLARTGESVSKVVISFTYEDSKAVYKYEVTYITAGNTLTVTQEVTKETKKSIWDEEKKDYVMTNEANEEIKNNLMNDFSLGNLQPGGNSFYREEALDAAYIIYSYADSQNSSSSDGYYNKQETNGSLSVKTASGKEVAFTINGYTETKETDNSSEDGGSYITSNTKLKQDITVNAFDLQSIPLFGDYITKGDIITLDYEYSGVGSESSTGTVKITVKSSQDVEKLAIVMTDTTKTTHNYENGVNEDNSETTGTIKVTASATTLVDGTVEINSAYRSEMIEPGDYYSIYKCNEDTTSIFNFTTFDMKEVKELFGLRAEDNLSKIEVVQKSEYKDSMGQSFDEKSSATIRVNDKDVDYTQLFSKLFDMVDGAIGFINEGVSLKYVDKPAPVGPYTFDYYVYNPETGMSSIITVNVSSKKDADEMTMNLKRGVADSLKSLLEAMMGGSGSMPNVNPNDFGSGNITNTSEFVFGETFFGAKNVTFTVNSPSTAAMPTYTIEFKDGYMKGAYTFTEEELWNNNMYY